MDKIDSIMDEVESFADLTFDRLESKGDEVTYSKIQMWLMDIIPLCLAPVAYVFLPGISGLIATIILLTLSLPGLIWKVVNLA